MKHTAFKPAWWLRNSHLQTLWPALLRSGVKDLPLERERMELPDGDFIDLDWIGREQAGPLVLILHGFEGSIESHYAKGMMLAVRKYGWRCVFMHFRGCSGVPNRLQRGYHSGETTDVGYVVKALRMREPDLEIAVIGYSLGGNVLLKWLGETGKHNKIKAAIAVSVPFELESAARRIQFGFSRIYEWYFLKCLRQKLLDKFQYVPAPIEPSLLADVYTLRDFDNLYTAPVHGFSSADEYYYSASSRRYLKSIEVPTLILHARDDPFMTSDVIPESSELSGSITLEVSECGGHVGFVSGKYPWRPEYWLEQRVPLFLREHFSKK